MEEITAALILWIPLMWIATSLQEIAHSLKALRGSTLNIHTHTRGPQP
jgi:hypothetical protein